MVRARYCALIWCAIVTSVGGASATEWSYRSYDQDGVRWHTLALEDRGYRLAFFCHGPGDGLKVTVRSPDPLLLPTAFYAPDGSDLASDLRIAGRQVIAGPMPITLSVDGNSSYQLELYHVAFYGVVARDDSRLTIADLLSHLRSARSVAIMRIGSGAIGPDRPLAAFDLGATDGAFGRLSDLCGQMVTASAPTFDLSASQ